MSAVMTPELPTDLEHRWLLHEGITDHAICERCGRGLAWTQKELASGTWLAILRAHVCTVAEVLP